MNPAILRSWSGDLCVDLEVQRLALATGLVSADDVLAWTHETIARCAGATPQELLDVVEAFDRQRDWGGRPEPPRLLVDVLAPKRSGRAAEVARSIVAGAVAARIDDGTCSPRDAVSALFGLCDPQKVPQELRSRLYLLDDLCDRLDLGELSAKEVRAEIAWVLGELSSSVEWYRLP